jgi:hypothetical protein
LSYAGCQSWLVKFTTPGFEHTLNFALDIVDGVGRLDLEGDGLTREGLDEDLHVEDLELRRRQVSSSLF